MPINPVADVSGIEADLSVVETNTEDIETKVDIVDVVVDGIDTKVDTIDTVVDGIDTKVDIIDTNVDTIETNTENIEAKVDIVDTVVDGIDTKVDTIDTVVDAINVTVGDIDTTVTSIESTVDDTASEVEEIERHLHSFERWFGAAVVPNGEIHVADRIGTTTAAFRADGGNNTWGSWLQILGSADTPADVGMTYFDGHRWLVTAIERANAVHFIQVAAGASGAEALAAGAYSEFPIKPITVQARASPGWIQSFRIAAGTKVWLRVWAVGQNTGTVDFFFGIHEYES